MSSIYYVLGLLLCVLTAHAENLTKEQQRILLDLQEAHLILEQAKAREGEVEIEHEQMIASRSAAWSPAPRATHCPRTIRARPRRAATGRLKPTARLPQLTS